MTTREQLGDETFCVIALANGDQAIVDACDYEWLSMHRWLASTDSRGRKYARSRECVNGKTRFCYMHRLIMGLSYGDGRQVDHINGDSLDNRRINLRISDHSQNGKNRGIQKNSTTGLKGVGFDKRWQRYKAAIRHNGKYIWLGYFDTPYRAHEAYKKAAMELHGEYARF